MSKSKETADKETADKAAADKAAARKPGVYVCAGKSVSTGAGIKGPGESIAKGLILDSSVSALVDKGYLEVEK